MESRNTSARNRFPTSRPNGSGSATRTVSIAPERTWVLSCWSFMPQFLGFCHVHISRFRITLHCCHSQVSPDAAMLEATERRFHVDTAVGVDAQHAAFDSARQTQRPIQI